MKSLFKSENLNKIIQIAGLWFVYFLIFFTTESLNYAQNKNGFIIVTILVVLVSIIWALQIKKINRNES